MPLKTQILYSKERVKFRVPKLGVPKCKILYNDIFSNDRVIRLQRIAADDDFNRKFFKKN